MYFCLLKHESVVQIGYYNFEKNNLKKAKNDNFEGFHDVVTPAVIFFRNLIMKKRNSLIISVNFKFLNAFHLVLI